MKRNKLSEMKRNRRQITLNENYLNKLIKESIKKVLRENEDFNEVPDEWYEKDEEQLNNDPRLMFAEMSDVFGDDSEVLEILLNYASDDEIRQWCSYLEQEQDKLF